ncbi:MAG: IS1634 family transposase [Ktedonobacteraceae bacterium]
MKEELQITTERIDDLVVLLSLMQQMDLPAILDRHLPRHWLQQGLSWGWTASIWLAHIVSQGDHRKVTVRDWVRQAHSTLEQVTGLDIRETDLTDDRLTIVLRHLSDATRWQATPQELGQHLMRVYDLEEQPIRVDATTVSGYRDGGEDSLWQFGYSKDDPTLRQIKAMMATLDPLGLPLTLEVVSGEQADDGLYVPAIDRVLTCLRRHGLLFVGDSKMSALATREHLEAHEQYYLTPLALVGETAERLPEWIEAGVAQEDELTQVLAEDEKQVLAQGYELSRTCVCEGRSWQERVLVVRSHAYAQTQHRHLEDRLDKARVALLALTPPVGRGKRQITEEAALQSAAEALLVKHRVVGLLTYTATRESQQAVKFVGRGRGGVNRPQQMSERLRYQITTVERNEEAIARFVSTLGWRAYATNAPKARLSLGNAVREYRHEYHIEHGFGRLKGAPLSIAPMFVKRDDQVTGLTQRLECGLTGADPHGVCGASLVATAGGHPGWTLQGQPAQSHCDSDGRAAPAGLCADHADPDAVARSDHPTRHAAHARPTANSPFVGLPRRSLC